MVLRHAMTEEQLKGNLKKVKNKHALKRTLKMLIDKVGDDEETAVAAIEGEADGRNAEGRKNMRREFCDQAAEIDDRRSAEGEVAVVAESSVLSDAEDSKGNPEDIADEGETRVDRIETRWLDPSLALSYIMWALHFKQQ